MVVPSARAASRRMRFDSDLEPGSLTVPEIVLMGLMVSCSTVEMTDSSSQQPRTGSDVDF